MNNNIPQVKPKNKILVYLILAIGFFILFKFFEPIFVYKFGWMKLPNSKTLSLNSELLDKKWAIAGVKLEEELPQIFNKLEAPGLSIAVAIDGLLAWRSTIGYADINKKIAVNYKSKFRIGSTSKAVTSVAIGALYNKGLIKFDSPIKELDPSLPEIFNSITLKQVMSHRSGIRNYGTCICFPIWEHLNNQKFSSIRDAVSVIENDPLEFKPGEHFKYTSLGYNLAGLVAEKTTGLSFSEVLNKEVFQPLNMENTSLELSVESNVNLVSLYQIEDKQYKLEFPVDNSIRWPSGGIISTPTDMVLLGSAMLDERLFSKESHKQLLTIPQNGRDNGGDIYALGWRVNNWIIDNSTFQTYNHNGIAVGSTSVFVIFPEHDIVVSAMINKSSNSIGGLTEVVKKVTSLFLLN